MFGFPHFHRWGVAVPVGGSGALSDALAAYIKDNGGTIRVSSTIKAIKVASGEAKGVVLDGGEEIWHEGGGFQPECEAALPQMLKSEELPAGFRRRSGTSSTAPSPP